jgi:hypothetical protein
LSTLANAEVERRDTGTGGILFRFWPRVTLVKAFRRALLALAVAGIAAGIARLRGSGGVPPQSGGWRELSGPELR